MQNKIGKILPILGFGEYISCKIFSSVIDEISAEGICSKSVDLSNIIDESDTAGKTEADLFNLLSEKISSIVEEKEKGGHIPVLSGYMGTFDGGIEKNIGRGYSDATAAICTVGLARKGYGVVLEIQKSVNGFLSADPRLLNNPEDAVCINTLDYLIAREITGDCGAQAKLLHHQTLRSEVQEAGVKIHLFNPFSGHPGSWIINNKIENQRSQDCKGVTFVGGRKGVVFFTISSGKMFEHGIFSSIFGVVKKYCGVDIVSTSESEISFTIDGGRLSKEELERMTCKIKQELHMGENNGMEFVEYRENKSLVFCVGQHMRDYVGLLSKATTVLGENNINIEIVSQGRLQRAMIFGIDEKDMVTAVNVLHKKFIT